MRKMENENNVIKVTKTVSEKFPPDTVAVYITAAAESKKYAEAALKTEECAAAIADCFKAAGFDRVYMRGVNVNPVRTDGKVTYKAARALFVEFEYSARNMEKALDIVSDNKCEWHINFMLKDRTAAGKLLTRAVEGARKSAEVIAAAANVRCGELVNCEYCSSDESDRPVMLRAAMYARNDGASLDPEEITVSETVVCSYKIC